MDNPFTVMEAIYQYTKKNEEDFDSAVSLSESILDSIENRMDSYQIKLCVAVTALVLVAITIMEASKEELTRREMRNSLHVIDGEKSDE